MFDTYTTQTAEVVKEPQHIDNLNSLKKLRKGKFEGPDRSLDISLFEYGLVWQFLPDTNEVIFVYGIELNGDQEYCKFDRVVFDANLDVYQEFNWVDWDAFYNYIGTNKDEWDEADLTIKILDLFGYYGYQEIFGTSYWEGFEIENN